MTIRLGFLADHPALIPTLADWHWAQWAEALPWWSRAEAESELRSHTGREAIPTTLLALDGEALLGSASLVVRDLPEWSDFGPWLASVYVTPSARGRGVASARVAEAVAVAGRLGVGRLHLITWDQATFYERRGWMAMDEPSRRVVGATVMSRVP